jgi:RHS repeat-associated protein
MPVVRYTVIDGSLVAEKRNGVRSLYVPDTQGNTVALLDDAQTQTDQWTHMPYGETTRVKGTNPTPFLYGGEMGMRTDSPGRIYARARVVEPPKARFMTEDPIGFEGRDFNLYAYAASNPTTFRDPSGLQKVGPSVVGGQIVGTPAHCISCAGAIVGAWYSAWQHYCNHGYTHCMACCTLERNNCSSGLSQHTQNFGTFHPFWGPAYGRLLACATGNLCANQCGSLSCDHCCFTVHPTRPGDPACRRNIWTRLPPIPLCANVL